MLLKRKLHGGVKHFCKGVALSSFLSLTFSSLAQAADSVTYPINEGIDLIQDSSVIIGSSNEEGDAIKVDVPDSSYNVTIITTNSQDGNINIDADDNIEGDAIHVTKEPEGGSISISAAQNAEIMAGNNGIDNSGNYTVNISAQNQVKITAGVGQANNAYEGDGARLEGSGSISISGNNTNISGHDEGLYIHSSAASKEGIKVTANGTDKNGFGNIISGDDNGIESAGSAGINVSAENGSNRIYGGNSAILNSGSGTIMITAGERPDESGISLLANQVGVDNLIGVKDGEYSINGIESDGTGLTDVYASHNNTIFGTENGILSSDSGTIKVTAENDNIIVQYTDDDENTVTSIAGINVDAGTVIVTAGNENNIYGTSTGINVSGENSNVTLDAKTNNINVQSSSTGNVYGIRVDNVASVGITSLDDINIDIDTVGVLADAIKGENSSNTILTAENGNITIDVLTGAPDADGGNVDGIDVDGSNTTLSLIAGQNIIITTQSSVVEQVPGAGANDVSGIRAESGSQVTAIADGSFYITRIAAI